MPQHGAYLAARLRKQRAAAVRDDVFAELLAEGYSVTVAAATMGLTQQGGSVMLARIRKRLGWQAA